MENRRFLVDTNVFLEVLLEQEKASESGRFLHRVAVDRLFMSDFTLHSIGVVLIRERKHSLLSALVRDLFSPPAVNLVGLNPSEILELIDVAKRYHLDFDDSYQYGVAEKYDLVIVTYDSDFARTARGGVTPGDVLSWV